jgi:hypothetical protein
MNTRQQFLLRAPLDVLVAAAACRNEAPPVVAPHAITILGRLFDVGELNE